MSSLRYERKYRIDTLDIKAVEAEVFLLSAGFRMHYPDRIVNNIYFDSPELKAFYENVQGVPVREKYRLRWYGPEVRGAVTPTWEVKKKINKLGTKTNKAWGELQLTSFAVLSKYLRTHLPPDLELVPTLLNRYQRSYFISADGNFRLTLDQRLEYCPLNGQSLFHRFPYADDGIILELKYDQQLDEAGDEIMGEIPFRHTKSSKYVTGMLFMI